MSSVFSFGGLKPTQTRKDLDVPLVPHPVTYKQGSGIVPIIMGEYVPGRFDKIFPQIASWLPEMMSGYMDPRISRGIVPGFKIICGLRTQHAVIPSKPLEQDIIATYKRNSWDFEDIKKELYDECPFVFATGRGLYTITRSDEVQARFFYDINFNKSYFYSPDLQKFVFPIDHISSLLRRVRTNFQAKGPHDALVIDRVVTGTDPKTIVADTYQTNFAIYQMTIAFSMWSTLLAELETYKAAPPLETRIVTSHEEIEKILRLPKRSVAVDIETSGLDFMTAEIGDLTISYDGAVGYYFPWAAIATHESTQKALHDCMQSKNLIGANFKFDLQFIRRAMHRMGSKLDWGPSSIQINDDIIQAGHVLNEQRLQSLKSQAWYYTPYGGYNRPLDEWLDAHPNIDNYLEIPDDIRIPYAAQDPCVTYLIAQEHTKQFNTTCVALDERDIEEGYLDRGKSLYSYYKDIMMPVVNMITDIEYSGVYVDVAKLEEEGGLIQEKLDVLHKGIVDLLEKDFGGPLPPFDITSPTQLGKTLELMGWPVIARNKAKVYSTNDDVLQKWEYMGYEAAKLIQEYRSWAVALKTFVGNKKLGSGWWKYVREHEEDGSFRMHASFAPMRAESGRHTCKEPNLQNIPAHGDIAKHVKRPIAVPSDDYYNVSVDFDAFQLKIAAVQSDDPTLVAVYSDKNSKADLHSITGYKIFGERLFNIQEVEFTDASGKVHTLFAGDSIEVERQGVKEFVTAGEYEFRKGDTLHLPSSIH